MTEPAYALSQFLRRTAASLCGTLYFTCPSPPACRDAQPVQFHSFIGKKRGARDGAHVLSNNDSWASGRPCLFAPAPPQHPSPTKLLGMASPGRGCQHAVPVSGLRATGTSAGHSRSCPPCVQLLNTPMLRNHAERSRESLFYRRHALPQCRQSLSHKDSEPRSYLGFCLKPPFSLGSERNPWFGLGD